MALYLISFNDEWVPDLTLEELRERGTSGRALMDEMTVAGVFVFSDGGSGRVNRRVQRRPERLGSPLFSERAVRRELQGAPRRVSLIVDVPDDAEARYW